MSRATLRLGLYAIGQQTADDVELVEWANAVIEGGAVCLQYRDKSSDAARRQRQADALARLCRARSVAFIINDDVTLALDCSADGVHLGVDDGDVATARGRLGPGALIGVSCYDSLDRARAQAALGASYLAFGAFFASTSKPGARRAEVSLLAAARSLGPPLVAIGGITPDNGGTLVAAGADLLAVIGGLAAPPAQAYAAARRFAALFDAPSPAPSS